MANIRVTCPACKTELEIDSSFEGQEVECGNCLEVFKAQTPGSSGTGSRGGTGKIPGASASSSRGRSSRDNDDEDERPRRRRLRRDDDDDYDDDEDYYSPPPPRSSGGGNGLAITALILGILAVFPGCCCGFLGIPLSLGAIVCGSIAMKNPEGKGMAITGLVLGILMLGLTIVAVVLNVGMNLNNPGQFR